MEDKPEGYIRPDFLFSYWIFVWFLIYFSIDAVHGTIPKFVKTYASPLFALVIALLFNIYELAYIMYVRPEIYTFIVYCVMMFSIKIFPIYLIISRARKINIVYDILAFVVIIAAYILYIYANGENVINIYNETEKSLVKGEKRTPLFVFIETIRSYLSR